MALELDGQQNVTARYTYFPGVDRPHSVVRNGSVYYYARGPTNSVTGLFDGSGQPVNQHRYGPWGEAELEVEGVENPYRYTGRRFDDETGLYHNRARYYDPDLARFISQDPLGLGAGINPYAYAGNDPVNAMDPSGLCPMQRASASVEDPFGPESISTTWTEDTGLCSGRGSWGLGATMMFGPKSMGRTKAIGQRGVSFGDLQGAEAQMPNVGRPDVSLPQADTVEADSSRREDSDACSVVNFGQEIGHHATVGPFGAVSGATVGVVAGFVVGASGGGTAGAVAGAVAAPFAGPVGPAVVGSGIVTGGLGGGVAGAAIGGEVGGVTGLMMGSFAGATKAGAECMLETLRF